MIALANSCYCSELKVIPKNWRSSKASVKEDWIVYYRFYDPSFKMDDRFKKGKLVRLKSMNSFKDLAERQSQTQKVIEAELLKLKEDGFNPITGLFGSGLTCSSIKSTTPFYQALIEAEKNITGSKSTKRDLQSVLRFIAQGATQLGLYNFPISQISRKHIKLLLNQIEINQTAESTHRYNKNRTYLMMLFKELVELEAVTTNPVKEISKKQRVITVRKVLTLEERKRVDQHLREHHYRFWLFTHLFYHSGARLTEIMNLKRKDIDLTNQTFTVTVKKGKIIRRIAKPIKNISLSLWEQAIKEAKPEDYIFSVGLRPGVKPINTDQITKRWKVHVKERLNIEADFYSLKHLHLDEISAVLSIEDAAAMASHTSTTITLKHYAVNEKQRQNNRLRNLKNKFA